MNPACVMPRLRPDLVVREQRQADGVLFVVKDPAAGRFFRFREREWTIARLLDGRTPHDAVLADVRGRLGHDLTSEALEQFVASLRRLGLLDGHAAAAGPAARPRRVRGSLLYLRFRAFDPDRLLGRLAPRVGFFFTRGFLLASIAVVLAAMALSAVEGDAIRRDLGGLWRFDALLFAWVTVLVVTAVHEFAHGLTCKRFGGEVHEMGFMLIYFQPAFYCNVSDAWLFPEKSRRLWVTFSGAYVEIVIWALASLVWRVVEPATWISFVALVVMATSGIKCLFNMNPLIKLDGYYLLSDAVGITNLRSKSIGYLGARVGRLFGGAARDAPTPTARERRIFLAYGLLAAAYSYWLLGWVIFAFGGYLMERYHLAGVVLFGGFLMMLLRTTLTRVWTAAAAAARGLRTTAGWKRLLRLAVAAAALAAVLVLVRTELTIPGEVTTLPLHNADVQAEVEGFVVEVPVHEGDRVSEGDVLVRLANRDIAGEKERLDAEIAEKRADLGMRLSRAASALDMAEARVLYGGKNMRRADTLRAQGLISGQQYDAIAEEAAVRRKQLEEAREELRRLGTEEGRSTPAPVPFDAGPGTTNPGRDPVALARAEIETLETRRRQLEDQLRLMTVVSPSAGVVTTPQEKLHDLFGSYVVKGQLLVKVYELQSVLAEIQIAEKDIGEVQPGQRVVVRAKAYPGRTFEGKVLTIAATATGAEEGAAAQASMQREKTFRVTTAIANPGLALRPGMTGHAKVYCGERTLLEQITRGLAGYLRVEFWSWW